MNISVLIHPWIKHSKNLFYFAPAIIWTKRVLQLWDESVFGKGSRATGLEEAIVVVKRLYTTFYEKL